MDLSHVLAFILGSMHMGGIWLTITSWNKDYMVFPFVGTFVLSIILFCVLVRESID